MRDNKKSLTSLTRYVGEENYHKGVVLDIAFVDIVDSIGSFQSVVGLKEDNTPTFSKPRFDSITASSHCEMPMFTKDYYLIGFTDGLGSSVKYRFFFEHCGMEYIKEAQFREIKKLEHFPIDCSVIARK